jgi:ABC-type transport system involved in cytochrome bd biosynthesis fused ATPase/permease subunit
MIAMSVVNPIVQNLLGHLYYDRTYPYIPNLELMADPEVNPEYSEQSSRAETMKSYAHSVTMRPELTIFGLKDWVVKEYQKSSAMVAEMEQPVDPNGVRHQIYDHITNFTQTGSRAIMYLLVALKSDYFEIPLPTLTYLEQSSQNLFQKTWNLWKRSGYMLHDMMAIQELFECMEIEPSMKPPGEPVEYETATSGSGAGMKVEVRGLSYKYPGKNEFVLKDISFVLQPGETLALLGFNGSGMSPGRGANNQESRH